MNKTLEWIFKLDDQISSPAKEITHKLGKIITALEKLKALKGTAANALSSVFLNINKAASTGSITALTNQIDALIQMLKKLTPADAAGFVALNRAFNNLKKHLTPEMAKNVAALSQAFQNLKLNPNIVTSLSVLSKALENIKSSLKSLSAMKSTNNMASSLAALANVNLDAFVKEINKTATALQNSLTVFAEFAKHLRSIKRAISGISQADLSNLRNININVRGGGGGGGRGGAGGVGGRGGNGGNGGGGGGAGGWRRSNPGLVRGIAKALSLGLRGISASTTAAGAPLAAIGGALGNKPFSGISLAGRMLSSAGPLVASLAALTSATLGLRAAILGISQQEQNVVGMKSLFGSMPAAANVMQYAIDFAAKTPFETGGVIKAVRTFSNAGFTQTQIDPVLQALADAGAAAGITGEQLNGVVKQMAQMKAKGKTQLEEIMIIAENGIPALDMIAKGLGLTTDQVLELTSKGKLSGDAGIGAIVRVAQQRYLGAAAEQAGTLAGTMTQLASRVESFYAMLAVGAYLEPGFDVLENFRGFMKNLLDLTDMSKNPGKAIKDGMAFFIGQFDYLFFRPLNQIMSDPSTGKAIEGFMLDMQMQFMKLVGIFNKIGILLQPAMMFIEQVIGGALKYLSSIGFNLTAFDDFLYVLVGGEATLSPFWQGVLDFFSALGPTINGAIKPILPAINNMIKGFSVLFQSEGFKTFTVGLMAVLIVGMNVISKAFSGLMNIIGAVAGSPILQDIFQYLGASIAFIASRFQKLIPAFQQFFANEKTQQFFEYLGQVIQKVAGLIGPAIGSIINAIKALVGGPVLPAILNIFRAVFFLLEPVITGGLEVITSFFNGLAAIFEGDFGRARDIFKKGGEALKNIFINVFKRLFQLVNLREMFNGVINFFQNLFNGISGIFSWDNFKGIGLNIITGLLQGIGQMFPMFAGVMDPFIASLKKQWGIASPSKVAFEMGNQIATGLNMGIAEGTPNVASLSPFSVGSPAAMPLPSTTRNVSAPISINININGATADVKKIAEEVRRVAVTAVLEALESAAVEGGVWA